MRTLNKNIFIVLLTLSLLEGCRKNVAINNKQAILFEVEYLNNLPGPQHSGIVIDKEGNVMSYKNPTNWNYPDNDLRLTSVQAGSNLANCVNTGTRINEEELLSYARYIKNISASKVTAIKHVQADSGSVKYICYLYDDKTGIYKGSLIRMEGAATCENLNFYSRRVAAWLKNLYEISGKNNLPAIGSQHD
jgi:hypothetical protein